MLRRQIIDVDESEGREGQHLQMAGAPVRTELLSVFLKNRRRGGLKHVPEVPRVAFEYHRYIKPNIAKSRRLSSGARLKCKSSSSSERPHSRRSASGLREDCISPRGNTPHCVFFFNPRRIEDGVLDKEQVDCEREKGRSER